MANPPRRLIIVLPWLRLRHALTIGDVRFGTLAELSDELTPNEIENAQALNGCFLRIRGTRSRGGLGTREVEPLLGLIPRSHPATTGQEARVITRLLLASQILACAVSQPDSPWPAEALQPYQFYLPEDSPLPTFPFQYANGYSTITSVDTFTITAPPWIPQSEAIYNSDVLSALGKLMKQALRSSNSNAMRTLSSLQWFVQSHAFAFNISDQPNLVALGTALEILLGIPKRGQGAELKKAVMSLTKSTPLGECARELYQARSAVVHSGRSAQPTLPAGHMSYLSFGHRLYWLCLQIVLIRRHHTGRSYVLGQPTFASDRAVKRLELALVSNRERLDRIAAINADRVAKEPKKQAEFIQLLQGLAYNRDISYTRRRVLAAIKKTGKVLKHILYHRSRSLPHGQLRDDMRWLGDHVEARSRRRPLQGHELSDMGLEWTFADHPGAYQKILAGQVLIQVLSGDEMVGGLCALLDRLPR